MKYVISDSEFEPIIVIGNTNHADLAKAFRNRVGSAGHFVIVNGRVHTYGRSIGIGIGTSERDAKLLEAYLNLDEANRLVVIPEYAKSTV